MSDVKNNATSSANWSDQKSKLKSKFSNLTDEDLRYDEGKKEEMFTRIQKKTGKTQQELDAVISSN